jgi:hypothetical protein
MSVDQKDVVDAISRSRDGSEVTLTVSDHLDWERPLEHVFTLQEKINSYLAFIESGQVLETFTDAKEKKIVIQVWFRCPPPEGDAIRFLTVAQQKIEAAGFLFRYLVHQEEANQVPVPMSPSGRHGSS